MERQPPRRTLRLLRRNRDLIAVGQGGGPETVAEGVSIYRRAVEAQGRVFDTSMVGLTRALHIAMTDREREAALALRARFMAQVEQLSLSPTGETPTLGRPRKRLSDAERNELTERDALIGRPDEIIGRIQLLRRRGSNTSWSSTSPARATTCAPSPAR